MNNISCLYDPVCARQRFNFFIKMIEKINSLEELDAMVTKAAQAPTEEERKTQILLSMLKSMSVSVYDEIPAEVNTLNIGGVQTFAREGLHFIKAKSKQGKSSALKILESVYISQQGRWGKIARITDAPLKVRHIDTEQKPYDTLCFKRQVFHLAQSTEEDAGENYGIINMRNVVDNDVKKLLIETLVREEKPDVLVIDGIVDLINNFNEIDESKELIFWLMHLADEYRVVLFCVLHTNKSAVDHNMRGHLGTMSEQKCDTTTECEKDEKTDIVTVKCANARHRPYPEWSYTWDNEGNLIDAEYQRTERELQRVEEQKAERERKAQELKDQRKERMLSLLKSNNGTMKRSELTEELGKLLNVGAKTISPLISQWIEEGILYQIGKNIQLSSQIQLFNS